MEEKGNARALESAFAWWMPLAFAFGSLACLAGRILTYPIKRDEHMFVAVAQQLPNGDLYRDLGYNHLPNLALLLSTVFSVTGTDQYLLIGRLITVAAWATALMLIWLIGKRMAVSNLEILATMALLVGNITLLGPPGMLATNSFIPVPFSFLAFYFLLGALDLQLPGRRRFIEAFLAGASVSIAIGFKANFIIVAPCFFLATLLAPQGHALIERVKLQCLPLCFGGLVGGLPTILAFMRDPEGMIAHTVRYFTVLHTSFWSDSNEPKALDFSDKILLAEEIWLSSTTLLLTVGILALAIRHLAMSGWKEGAANLLRWPVLLSGALVLAGIVISFVPTPSFTQYFVPPIPFLVLAFLAVAPTGRDSSGEALPILLPLLALALIAGSIRLVPGLVSLTQPSRWTGNTTNEVMHEIMDQAGLARDARIATMSPILALEGGRTIYPEFAAGQFVFRVAPYMTPEERQFYRTTSPVELAQFLDENQPDAIVVDTSEPIESTLSDYALSQGYREIAGARAPGSLEFRMFVPRDGRNARMGAK